jgi:hypothetical protein
MKKTFEVEGKKYAVIDPTREAMSKARAIHARVLGEALANKAPMRPALFNHMRAQGLWDDTKDQEYKDLLQALDDGELKLARGGIKLKEARDLAIKMRQNRMKLRLLLVDQSRLDAYTMEGMAENARFDALASMCIVDDETGKPVYSSPEDYELNKSDDVAINGATLFAQIYYDYDENAERALPENQFLLKWKFSDDDGRLVNEKGRLIDIEGRLINEQGQYVDDDGNVIDEGGRLIDDDGNFVVEFSPFLDDDGNPVGEEAEEEVPPPPAKKKVSRKKTTK